MYSQHNNIDRASLFFSLFFKPRLWYIKRSSGISGIPFFSDKMSSYLGGIARESFLSSSVCVLARRVSTRVHAARELSHTCRIPILGKLSSRTLLRYVHQTRRRATLNLANVMLPLVLRYIRYYECIITKNCIRVGIGKCYFITSYDIRIAILIIVI